jgi:hypothetical protein
MKAIYPFQESPRCSATSKRTRERCKAPAVRGWTVCRFHGARGGAPKGEANGAYKHGLYTQEAKVERRRLSELLELSRDASQRSKATDYGFVAFSIAARTQARFTAPFALPIMDGLCML